MYEELFLSPDAELATNAGVVRRVVRQLVDEALRSQIILQRYRENLAACAEKAAKARDEWMRGQGMHVWIPEENEFFSGSSCALKCTGTPASAITQRSLPK